jgi:hypothetical protein
MLLNQAGGKGLMGYFSMPINVRATGTLLYPVRNKCPRVQTDMNSVTELTVPVVLQRPFILRGLFFFGFRFFYFLLCTLP